MRVSLCLWDSDETQVEEDYGERREWMDLQPILHDITGGGPQTQPKTFEVKPQWLLRRAAYLRANAIQQRNAADRGGRRERRRGLFRLPRRLRRASHG